jgi:hypothetical protein
MKKLMVICIIAVFAVLFLGCATSANKPADKTDTIIKATPTPTPTPTPTIKPVDKTDTTDKPKTALTGPFAGKKILLATKYDGTTLTPHDTVLNAQLQKLGFVVTPMHGKTLTGDEAAGFDLVFISEVSDSNAVKAKFINAKCPVLSCEAYINDDMGFTGLAADADFGKIENKYSALNIVKDGHPMAAGFTGSVSIYKKPGTVNFAKPGGDVQIIAVTPDDPTKALIFGYDKGAKTKAGDVTPARRVVFFLFGDQENNMTDDGWKLFEAAVTWAMGK